MDMIFRLWTIGLPALSGAWFDAFRRTAPKDAPAQHEELPGPPIAGDG